MVTPPPRRPTGTGGEREPGGRPIAPPSRARPLAMPVAQWRGFPVAGYECGLGPDQGPCRERHKKTEKENEVQELHAPI